MNDRVGDWHVSGVVELTGRPDGAGLLPPGSAATVARQLSTYLRRATARSAHVIDVDGRALLSERARFTGWTRQGRRSVGGHTRLLPTSDGWVVVACARPDDPALLGALIGHDITEVDPWPLVEDWILAHAHEYSKIETPRLPDGARRGNTDFYRLLHGGHESLVIDPSGSDVPPFRTSTAPGRQQLRRRGFRRICF
ncbi:MAG: hypothetical protein WBD41_05130 [Rhodococcus sp. (in: high G+C Gram-positive bacteria)]|uniref:hypothetical protein n=1 Tax=Rhodococcus sp. EPR-157 TaxID=1813677 RepID=UPI0007BB17FE|nr:hypothetical protein [Rhodococcus sp. EPR-157]KZF12526.1 hypothetical protein A2J03_17170 [Rhodococcus sp. EPR-157]